MKKSIFVLLLLAMPTFCLAGSDKDDRSFRRHEFSASLGFGANPADKEVNNALDKHYIHRDWYGDGECGDILGESFAMLNLEYNYRLTKQWAIGAIMGWGRASEGYYRFPNEHLSDFPTEEDRYSTREDADMTSKVFYVAPSLRYAWFLRGKFRLYSRLAVGAMRQHTSFKVTRWEENKPSTKLTDASSDEVKWKLAYQLTPVGFDFGIEPIRVYSELGYGCRGVFTIGVRVGL